MKRPRVHFRINLLASVLLCMLCGILMPFVNVNSDMTKYLPDSSPMRAGLEVLDREFDMSAMPVPEVRVMLPHESDTKDSTVAAMLMAMDGVNDVSSQSRDGYTLHELTVSKELNQKKLAKRIKDSLGESTVTQTAQDGNTPDPIALIIAMIALIAVLFVMSQSWVEPILFLLATGMAVVVNTGTNIFMGSVSITTASIVAVLQLVLSMDYSIILMNRYRQQKPCSPNIRAAMTSAIRNAAPAILSSSFTTIVGLLMLAFMRLKIGADLGFVLAKGVVCSLFYVYIALPGLVLLCDKWIEKTRKPVPMLPTAWMARYSEKFRIPLTVLFVLIVTGSYILHNNTPVTFSTAMPSPIDDVFPKQNRIIVLYNNADEASVNALMDYAGSYEEVQKAVSYPSLMLRQMTAPEMMEMIKGLSPDGTGMLTEEMLRLVYHAANQKPDTERKMSFMQMTGFLRRELADSSSMLRSFVDPEMAAKLSMLDALTATAPKASLKHARKSVNTPARPAVTDSAQTQDVDDGSKAGISVPDAVETQHTRQEKVADEPSEHRMGIHDYARMVYAAKPDADSRAMLDLSDISMIRREMDATEMSTFMGSTLAQTRMIYSFSKGRNKEMTPLDFGRFLVNDLFKRKALSSMVSADQKAGMEARLDVMEAADKGVLMEKDRLEKMAARMGISTRISIDATDAKAETAPAAAPEQTSVPAVSLQESEAITTAEDIVWNEPGESTVADKAPAAKKVRKSAEERKLETVMDMISSGRKYTAKQMSAKFAILGEKLTPEMVDMLYLYHDVRTNYDGNCTMCLKDIVDYIAANILDNPLYASYIDDSARESFARIPSLTAQMKGPEHSLAVLFTDFKDESPETESFIRGLQDRCDRVLGSDHYLIGESVMFCEMKDGFSSEMTLVTLLTIFAILTIVAITFRSLLTALILVMTVMSAVFVNVAVSGIGGGSVLYLAYVIVQSILMGATIDYGILFASNLRESGDIGTAYKNSIQTILTSGLIIILVPGVMAMFLNDAMIRPIVSSLSLGALAAVAMMLLVTPGVLATFKPKKKEPRKKIKKG